MTTFAVSLGVIVTIVGLKLVTEKIPGALIAVLGALAVSYFADLSEHGVSVLGTVPGGLPSLGLPDGMSWSDVGELFPTAVSIFVLILAQSAATSRAYAAKYNERFSEDTDLVGLGLANGAAAISGTFVVNGSPTKTQMVDSAGGRSQLAQITTGAITVIVLLFLTKPLEYLPNAVLAAVVFLIGIELVDIAGMRRIARVRPDEFVVALMTAARGRPDRCRAGHRAGDHRLGHRPPAPLVQAEQHDPRGVGRPDQVGARASLVQDLAGTRGLPLQRLAVLRQRQPAPAGDNGADGEHRA